VTISTGSGTGYEKVPFLKRFDGYEVYDNAEGGGVKLIAAMDRGVQMAPGQQIRLGGILGKFFYREKVPERPRMYLETLFYTRL
jgi:hypothetical protein